MTSQERLVEGVIWDLDGVLVDTAAFHFQAWQALAGELGRTFSEEDFRRTFGQRNQEIIRQVFDPSLAPAQVEALGQRKEVLFRTMARGRVRALPGALALLSGLAALGLRQALATSTPRENVTMILGELGAEALFQAIVSAEDVRAGKPDPEGFLLAAERLGVPPARAAVLEDSVGGAQAAAAAGMRCVAIAGSRPPDLFARQLPPGSLVVPSLEGLTPQRLLALLHQPRC